MIKEHERVILTNDPVTVHVRRGGEAFEVEFFMLQGETAAIVAVDASCIRSLTQRDMTHAHLVKQSA